MTTSASQDDSLDAAQGTAQILCRLDEIEDGEGRGFTIETADGPRDIFVVRDGNAAYGYVNSCPHTGTPLDWTPDKFMSEDGGYIMCAPTARCSRSKTAIALPDLAQATG